MPRHDCLLGTAPFQGRLVHAVEMAAITCDPAELQGACGASGFAAMERLAARLRFDPKLGVLFGLKPSDADPVAVRSVELALLAAFLAGLSA